VSERSEVPRCPDRSLGRNEREDGPVEQLEKLADDERPDPGVSLGEGPGAEKEHGADDLVWHRWSETGGMRPEQVVLECLGVGPTDVGGGQGAKSCGYPVDDLFGGHRIVDQTPRRLQSLVEIVAGAGIGIAEGDRRHLLGGKRPSVDDDCFHALGR
jgi:hypothetical protein